MYAIAFHERVRGRLVTSDCRVLGSFRLCKTAKRLLLADGWKEFDGGSHLGEDVFSKKICDPNLRSGSLFASVRRVEKP